MNLALWTELEVSLSVVVGELQVWVAPVSLWCFWSGPAVMWSSEMASHPILFRRTMLAVAPVKQAMRSSLSEALSSAVVASEPVMWPTLLGRVTLLTLTAWLTSALLTSSELVASLTSIAWLMSASSTSPGLQRVRLASIGDTRVRMGTVHRIVHPVLPL